MTNKQLGHRFESISLLAKASLTENIGERTALEHRAAALEAMSAGTAPGPDIRGAAPSVLDGLFKNMGRR